MPLDKKPYQFMHELLGHKLKYAYIYTIEQPALVRNIEVVRYSASGDLKITISFLGNVEPTRPMVGNFMSQLPKDVRCLSNSDWDLTVQFESSSVLPMRSFFDMLITFTKPNKEDLTQVNPSVQEVINDICKDAGVLSLPELINKPFEGAMDLVLAAQKKGDFYPSIELLNFYWQRNERMKEEKSEHPIDRNQIKTLAQAIIPENKRCFQLAQRILGEISFQDSFHLGKPKDPLSLEDSSNVTEEALIKNYEEQIGCALALAGTDLEATERQKNQMRIDHFATGLLRGAEDNPITNIGIDWHKTFFDIAEMVRGLKSEKSLLEAQLAGANKTIAAQQMTIKKLTKEPEEVVNRDNHTSNSGNNRGFFPPNRALSQQVIPVPTEEAAIVESPSLPSNSWRGALQIFGAQPVTFNNNDIEGINSELSS